MKELTSPSALSASKTLFAALNILKNNGDGMPIKALSEEIENTVFLSDWEKGILEKTGNVRWKSAMHFTSVDYVVAGYLVKKKGVWYITPEGEAALQMGAVGMFLSAKEAYDTWYRNKKASDSEQNTYNEPEDESTEKEVIIELEELEERASDGIREYIRAITPYEYQDLVAALLRAMGYYTPFIAPKGKDGGVDIIAYVDPLGAQKPRIKVQVKHKPDTSIPAADVRALLGVLKTDDIALFVTSGTFSSDARNTALNSKEYIRLIDGTEFMDMWQLYYDKMTDEDKNMLPLKRIAFVGDNG